jgi:hypothetical protein
MEGEVDGHVSDYRLIGTDGFYIGGGHLGQQHRSEMISERPFSAVWSAGLLVRAVVLAILDVIVRAVLIKK